MSVTTQFSQLRQDIAGHSLVELADRFGTPSYIYDLSKILQRVADLQAFDTIRYAQKACSNIAILDRLRRADVLVDAVSAGEIGRALRAGYQPSQIIYTADVFDRDALELVIQKNVPVNVGSPDMIDQLGQRAPGRNITLRINPGFGHGHSQKTNTGGPQSKHGIWYQQIDDCLLRADRHGLVVTGLHIHIGSGTDFEHLSQVCGAMEQACLRVGRTVTSISTGGGLPVPYREGQSYIDLDQYYQLWNAARDRIAEQLGHSIHLEIEPGRYLVAESGYLVTEICAIKTMGENLYYMVDADFSDMARPILYGAYHPISICQRNPPDS
ncbi:MAG TPA: diaminopimelate decarboxylase, partial [Planctomycetaceae bacterium]|nr:diaminopimelate decarboxylase [Planctomycetaceae bacterium]